MDAKALRTLEYDKILSRLAAHCAFSASEEAARALRPVSDLDTARLLQAETAQARQVLALNPGTSIGGARDVRAPVDAAARSAVLLTSDLLDIKATLISARTLARFFEKYAQTAPRLVALAAGLPPPLGLVDAISRALSDRGELLDTGSEALARIRKELRVAHDRLLTRLQRMVANPDIAPLLQDNLVTQRDGRYVLPLRAEFKGRIKAVVHDQSASGATLFVEPLAVVDLNNRYRELQLEERDEEQRILADLSRQVGGHASELTRAVETLAGLDLVFAKAKYAEELEAVGPVLKPLPGLPGGPPPVPDFGDSTQEGHRRRHPGSVLRLWSARHPLLDPETVVPIDLELDSNTYALVITGPNTGGKTVTLKTVGLLALMAQSGLALPVQSGSEISVFHAVYADIGDEQSIEQSLSTFSGHIRTIIHILQKADSRSLVLLDELGAGTDPQEGAALAQAILSVLLGRGVTTLVATHFPELKAFSHAAPGVVNASVEFNLDSLSPTYHLTIGLPGRSNALAIAQRLGLPQEILERARGGLGPTELRAESLLEEIHHQRDIAREAREAAEAAHQEAEDRRAELVARLAAIEEERREVLETARREAAEQIVALKAEVRELEEALARARLPLDVLEPVEEKLEALEEEVETPVARRSPAGPELASPVRAPHPLRPVQLGDRVRLRSLGTQGVVSALGEQDAEVQVGNLRVRTQRSELELVSTAEGETVGAPGAGTVAVQEVESGTVQHARPESPGIELNLRGSRVDEALEALDRYLDAAYLAGLPYVRIIHGKGTGRLRDAVRRELGAHPYVASFEPGGPSEGGEGVTVARLRG